MDTELDAEAQAKLHARAEALARSVAYEILSHGFVIQYLWDNAQGDEKLYGAAYKAYALVKHDLQAQLQAQGLFPGYKSAD